MACIRLCILFIWMGFLSSILLGNETSEVLPNEITITFQINSFQNVTLHLVKSDMDEDFLTILSDNGNQIVMDTSAEIFEVYEESKKHATVSVIPWTDENGQPTLKFLGVFLLNKTAYEIVPATDNSDLDKGFPVLINDQEHFVFESKIENYFDEPEFSSDYLEDVTSLKNHGRVKREAKTPITVDTLVVADYSIYKIWLELENKDVKSAVSNIRYYYAHVINGINMKYRSIVTSKYEFSVRMVALYIAQKPEDSDFTEDTSVKLSNDEININLALNKFKGWLAPKLAKKVVPEFDVAAAFTSYGGTGEAGLGTIAAVCTPRGASIIRDKGIYSSIETAAHEIGHNLGALHDGEKNECKSQDQYIMTPSHEATNKNNHDTFSPCSIKSFEDYIDELDRKKNNCLRRKSDTTVDLSKELKVLLGQKYTPDQQCQQAFGKDSYYCSEGGLTHEKICLEMFCHNPKLKACQRHSSMKGLNGTLCGNQKWCMGGKCVHDPKAPKGKDFCLYGNDPNPIKFNDEEMSCETLQAKKQLSLCKGPDMFNMCCKACEEGAGPDENCKYGDEYFPITINGNPTHCKQLQSTKSLCYNENLKTLCCETCGSIRDAKHPDCEFGDKYSNCHTFPKNQLKLICQQKDAKEGCCETCRPFM